MYILFRSRTLSSHLFANMCIWHSLRKCNAFPMYICDSVSQNIFHLTSNLIDTQLIYHELALACHSALNYSQMLRSAIGNGLRFTWLLLDFHGIRFAWANKRHQNSAPVRFVVCARALNILFSKVDDTPNWRWLITFPIIFAMRNRI